MLLKEYLQVASVGLLVTKSHDSGEIAGNLMMLFADILFTDILFIVYDIRLRNTGDKIINKSYKYINLLLVDSSLNYKEEEIKSR